MEYVAPVAGKIVNYIVGKVGEQLGYLIDYGDNIKALEEKIEILKRKKKDVQQKIKEAKNNLRIIYDHVEKWDQDVVEFIKGVDKFLAHDQNEATHRCFNGWCINLWARYKFGKKASEKVDEIEKKLKEAEFESVSYRPHDLPSSREMLRGFESRKKMVKKIVKALYDENINLIGICGTGGVGKTTIVNEIRTKVEEEKKFDKIVMVVVSQNPDFTKIQDDIAKELGLLLEESTNRSAALREKIKGEKKIVIILDDVWKKIDLKEDVGIPFGEDHKGCKILLTTRKENVCRQMDAQIFHIEGLQKEVGDSESRQRKVRDIVKALDDENINMIGICGMGGVGKTTIVKKVCTQAKEEKKFDKIVMVVVSQHPNFTKIQDDIAKELGLNFEEWPNRRAALRDRIKMEKKIMIILDDVWKRFDLIEDVGIPFGKDHKGCKIVLTTREENVCKQMDARIFHIEGLPEREGLDLFRETLGETANNLDSELENIAIEVTQACRGLPIAIATVGMALKKQNKDVWIDFSKQLKKPIPSNIPGMDGFVYSRLELSYRYLESNEAKSLFLLCSLFPEDFEIDVGSLAQYGMGLRLFQHVNTIEDGRARSRSLVSTLVSSFLLLKGTKVDYVKMHDVVRDTAIVIASKEEEKKYMVKAGVGLRDWPNSEMTASFQSYVGVSLMYNDIKELPDELESPKLQVLLLQNNSKLHIPTNFFRGIKNLKVLDMGRNRIRFMPESIQCLTSLKTLCLDGCKLGDNISIIGTLNQLEILNLRESDIKEVPGNFRQLINLMSLDLRNCYSLIKIASGVVSSLRKLEELYIAFNFTYWAGIEGGEDSRSNASLSELKPLTRLTSLSICVPNVNLLLHDPRLQSLTEFDIICYDQYDKSVDYHHGPVNRKLALSYDTANYKLSAEVHDLLKRTKSLILIDCKGSTNILKDFDNNEGFVELEYLNVCDCNDMKCLLDTVDGILPFPNLKGLRLNYLPKFMEICHGLLPAKSFSKLQELVVHSCDSMSNLFDLDGDDIKLFPNLENLYLTKLQNLIHVWKGPHDHFVKLHNQLRSIVLRNCPNLRQLFPPSIAQSLVHLEELTIGECNNMEEIFGAYNEDEINQTSAVEKSSFRSKKKVQWERVSTQIRASQTWLPLM